MRRDAAELVGLAQPEAMNVLYFNRRVLRMAKLYEPALMDAWVGAKVNHHSWPLNTLRKLFESADRRQLLALGASLPTGPIVVYRGVSGSTGQCMVRGLSWTLSLDVACFFALRFGYQNPEVYRTTVTSNDVFLMTNDRDEREVICRPRGRLARLANFERMQAGHSRFMQQHAARNNTT